MIEIEMSAVNKMKKPLPLLILSLLLLTGCAIITPYQPDVHQGNVMTPKMVQQLALGQSPAKVEQIMGGAPVLQKVFASDQTVYLYTFRPGKGHMTKQQLILTFKQGKLMQIEYTPTHVIR
jgi:outer membrane protein assembly factor BamE (lipoprotein component of BamABCDE complex)